MNVVARLFLVLLALGTVLLGNGAGFQDKPFFKAEEGARQVPKVDFSK